MADKIRRIDFEHYKIHKGEAYGCAVLDASMGDGDALIITFKTPNTDKFINMTITYSTKAGGHMEVIEAPTWDSESGSVQPIRNKNRNSSNTSGITEDSGQAAFTAGNAALNQTSVAGGTTVCKSYVFGAARIGGSDHCQETILKKNTQYAFKYTADGATNAGFIKLEWYEHTDDIPAT